VEASFIQVSSGYGALSCASISQSDDASRGFAGRIQRVGMASSFHSADRAAKQETA